VPGELVEADFDLSKGADAQGLAKNVVANFDLLSAAFWDPHRFQEHSDSRLSIECGSGSRI
jgi:hypothetical protein